MLGLTAAQVAERAGVHRLTVGRLERGDPQVGLGVFLTVARVLGRLDAVVTALDPYETDLGRARADDRLPRRVRSGLAAEGSSRPRSPKTTRT